MDMNGYWILLSLFFHCTVCLLCHHTSRIWNEKGKDLDLWGAHLKRQQDWNVKSKQQQCKMGAAVSQLPLSSQTCKMSLTFYESRPFSCFTENKCYDFSVTGLYILKMPFSKSHLALLTGNCVLNSEQCAAAVLHNWWQLHMLKCILKLPPLSFRHKTR